MRKLITCSFDPNGVVITAWNGVHPDRPGHFSITKAISRMEYNDACKDRKLFGKILGVDITLGWQNPLNDAIKNASNLKIDMQSTVDLLVKLLVARYGEEEATRLFEELDKDNEKITAEIEKLLTEEPVSAESDVPTSAEPEVTTESDVPTSAEPKEEKNGDDTTGDKPSGTGKGRKKSGRKVNSELPAEPVTGDNK